MKIKTLTCHEVYNYGASLQAYALLEYLKKQGYDVETINYKPPYLSKHFDFFNIGNEVYNRPIIKYFYLLAKLPERIKNLKRKGSFDNFTKKYIPMGSIKYTSNEELKKKLPEADVFICGSDQIWNSYFENGRDPAFYLNFVPDDKTKIAYAASFAMDAIEDAMKPLVRDNVKRIASVSVRETSAVSILNDLGIDTAVQVLDPVFLVEVKQWKKFVSSIDEKFIFVNDFDSNPLLKKIALEFKKKKRWKIYTVNQNIDYADTNFWLEGPEKYLSLMYHASFVLTNSFHSVCFSIIFEKQLVVVNRIEPINTRMRDLLSLFHLSNCLVENYDDYTNLERVDYNLCLSLTQFHIEKSKQFLLNAIEN